MKKVLILFNVLFIFGCSGNKVITWDTDPGPQRLKSNKRYFNQLLDTITEKEKPHSKRLDDYQDKYLTDYYDFEAENITWAVQTEDVQDVKALNNHIAPAISVDEDFILSYNRITPRGRKISYDLTLTHTLSKNQMVIMSTNDDQFDTQYQKFTPQFSWCPIGNFFAFTSIYKKSSNIFVGFPRFNQNSVDIEIAVFQVTNNKNDRITFTDPQISKNAKYLSFTKLVEEEKAQIIIYDLEKKQEMDFGDASDDIRGLRFGRYDEEMASFVKLDDEGYNAYIVDDFSKRSDYKRRRKISFIHNELPFIYTTFADYSEYAASLALGIKESSISIYNYRYDSINFEILKDFDINMNLQVEFFPITSPFWIFNDKVLILSGQTKLNSLFTLDKNFKENNFHTNNLSSMSQLNSISKTFNDKIYYSGRERNFVTRSVNLNLDRTIRKADVEFIYYKFKIEKFDAEELTAKLIRKGRPLSDRKMQNVSDLPTILAHTKEDKKRRRKDFDMRVGKDKKDSFLEGREVTVKFPKDLRRTRKFDVKVKFSTDTTVIDTTIE